MIGYHYTSHQNYLRIIKEGIKIYDVNHHPSVLELAGITSLKGVWIWINRLQGLSHHGQIIWTMSSKGAVKVVLLAVKYNRAKTLKSIEGENLSISHTGSLGNLIFHTKEKSVISLVDIPKKDIKLISIYDLNLMFEMYENSIFNFPKIRIVE